MKARYLFASAALTGALAACNFADLDPIDSLTDQSYWTSVNDLKLYATSLYGNLDAPGVGKDAVSDHHVTTSYSAWLFDESIVPASGGGWDAGSWSNIRSCNVFLSRYRRVAGAEADINRYVAEVRFFRALDYYGKVKTFGDVPWYDTELQTTDTEQLYKARDSRDFVLGKIIEDLDFAIAWLPDGGSEERGRLSKDAARQQLARVCLYFGTYKKYHSVGGSPSSADLLARARDLTAAIMATGRYSIVQGSDNGASQMPFDGYPLHYSNQFVQADLSGNAECILARYYSFGEVTHETGRQAGSTGIGLSRAFVESFLCTDGQPISVSTLYQGNKDNATLEDEFTGRDPRMYQIVDNPHKPYLITNGVREVNARPNVASNEAVTGYPCVKYRSPLQSQWEARSTDYDWFVYRYAETLLINAEAHAELGTCTQEVLDRTIKPIRDRVGMPGLNVSPVRDTQGVDYGYDVSDLIREIRRERGIELVCEGHRYDDLVRWNAMKLLEDPKTVFGIRITDAVRADYAANNVTFGGSDGRPTAEYRGSTYLYQYAASKPLGADGSLPAGRKWSATDKRWLNPLPTDQLTLNPNLGQNPGW